MSLVVCPICEGRVSDKAEFCPRCGLPIEIIIKKDGLQSERRAYCWDCGTELSSYNNEICLGCGWIICPVCNSCNPECDYGRRHRFNENGFNKEGFDRQGFDRNGFNKEKIHRNGTLYNELGFDYDGYNKDGFDKNGYDKNGYDINGYDNKGRDKNGYDKKGFLVCGVHKSGTKYDYFGYDIEGRDINGFNRNGFNRQGIHKNGMVLNKIKSFETDDYPNYGKATVYSVPYYVEKDKQYYVNLSFNKVKKTINCYDIEAAIQNGKIKNLESKK